MQAEAIETSLSSRVAALLAKVRKQIEAYPAEGQGVNLAVQNGPEAP